MKILIASDLHWPTINGVATFSRNLAFGLAERGHEVVVIAPSQTGKAYVEKDRNHTVYRTVSVPFPFYQNFRISLTPQREVKKIIEDFQPDIIHIQMLMWIGQATMKYGNKFGIPVVSTNHAMPENLLENVKLLAPVARPISYMLKEYGRRFFAKSDYITLPTQSAIDMFNAYEQVSVPIKAVSNGIDLSRFRPGEAPKSLYKKYKIPTDVPIVTYVGRLDAEKHLYVLIRAFKNILSDHDSHLVVVGDGNDRENMEHLSSKLGIRRHVTFCGKVSDEDLVLLHKIGKVFCMPSPAELQSIATLEAMASGLPVVAVDAGALKELCQNGRNGYLCNQDDYQQIANSILKILSDSKKQHTMSKESLAIAHDHDINTTFDTFEEIYRSLIIS